MEQKRVLWIVIAAGIFLLVVLCPAIILYKPVSEQKQSIVPIAQAEKNPWSSPKTGYQEVNTLTSTLTQVEDANNANRELKDSHGTEENANTIAQNLPRDEFARVGDMTVIAQNATVYTPVKSYESGSYEKSDEGTLIDLNAINKMSNIPSSVSPKNEITANKIESVKQTTYTPPKNASPVKSEAKAVASSAKVSTSTKVQAAKKASVQAKSSTSKSNQTQYWVQAASFSNKNGAETARSALDTNKIPADVFTYKDKQGKVFYRVRVGPYTTKSEAEYWRTRIVQIDDFKKSSSYVTQTLVNN